MGVPRKIERPKQPTPQEIVEALMQEIRAGFYAGEDKKFFQDRDFLLRRVVLWPAGWLNAKGVTLPAARYREILHDIFQGIKQHGNTGAVQYWPGYLAHAVQTHYGVHGEEYYEEGKRVRAKVESALLIAGQRPASTPDPVAALAAARGALITRRPKRPVATAKQLALF